MVPTNGEPAPEDLTTWQQNLVRRANELRTEVGAKQAELARVEERLNLVRKLLELDGSAGAADGNVTRANAGASETKVAATPPTTAKGVDLEGAVSEILREAGTPLHISDIRAALIDRHVPIPGKGDEANIIVRLRRLDRQFTRTARGTYALAEWGLQSHAPTRKRRPRRASR
jgi:hypothetical protein